MKLRPTFLVQRCFKYKLIYAQNTEVKINKMGYNSYLVLHVLDKFCKILLKLAELYNESQ